MVLFINQRLCGETFAPNNYVHVGPIGYPVGHGVSLAEPSDNRKNAVILDSHFRGVLHFR